MHTRFVCLIAKGNKMNIYKKVFPYVIMGTSILFGKNSANAQSLPSLQFVMPKLEIQLENKLVSKSISLFQLGRQYDIRASRLQARATHACDKYIDNMLAAQKRLQPKIGTRGYNAAVRRELPGAPVGMHCMYGQYTQLMRALNENGDTLKVIPTNGKSACSVFKDQMRKKYSRPEYDGAIKEGRVFKSDSAYNAALEKYLAQRGINASSDKAARQAATAEFAKKNFSAAQVSPGSIWIVPRFRGAKTKFHAIMFLGEGRIKAGEFVPGPTGQYMFTAHNRERIGDVFESWDTSNVFSADIEKILQIEYTKELKRLESMSRDKMIEYIKNDTGLSAEKLMELSHDELLRLVHAKYFGDDLKQIVSAPTPEQIAMEHQLQISRC